MCDQCSQANRILFLTACFGLDKPRPCVLPALPNSCKRVCYTETTLVADPTPGWEYVCFTESEKTIVMECIWIKGITRPNVLKSRFVKSQFHRLSAVNEFNPTIVIWIDANIQVIADKFQQEIVELLENNLVVTYPHNFLSSAHSDLEAGMEQSPYTIKRYSTEPLKEQLDHYNTKGFTRDVSFKHKHICSGITAVRLSHDRRDETTSMLDKWWAEIMQWSIHDQVCLAFILWQNNISHGLITDGTVTGSSSHWFWNTHS